MAVQAQQYAFLPHHDLGLAGVGRGDMLLDALGVGAGFAGGIGDAVFGGEARPLRSEVTYNGNGNDAAFPPRKRARVAPAPGFLESGVYRGVPTPLPPAVPQGQVFAACDDVVRSRALGCGAAASTSGRADVSGACLAQLYLQDVEIDALVRIEMERMRVGMQEARQRHLRAVAAAADRAASGRLRAAEAELDRARCRNAELEERVRQLAAEGQAWLGVARTHEAVAAGLRATLDQLQLQQPAAALDDGDAEDARSCCFETAGADADDTASCDGLAAASCKSCRGAEACVLVLPCRHLCLCRACEPGVDACPVCAATKNASLQVLLS